VAGEGAVGLVKERADSDSREARHPLHYFRDSEYLELESQQLNGTGSRSNFEEPGLPIFLIHRRV
jgi:hypothetical protein